MSEIGSAVSVHEVHRELVARDFREFLKYARILEPLGSGQVEFQLWPHLDEMVDVLAENRLISVLKARQIGLSWILAPYAYWTAAYHPGAVVLLLSQGQAEAAALLNKCRYINAELPDHLKPVVGADSSIQMTFPEVNSKLTALPSTENAGRGEAATLVVQDEADFHDHLDANYAAVKPTIDAGGQLIQVSTVNKKKMESLFKQIYRGAPGNGFAKKFFGWDVRPGRDQAWYDRVEREAPDTAEMSKELYMEQEYPRCLSPETLVSTNPEGILPISESKHAFVSGEGQLWEMRTEQGRKLLLTKEHRIHTSAGYEELQNLETGSPIDLMAPKFSEEYVEHEMPPRFHNERRSILIDETWARFLGFFVGDGSISGRTQGNRQQSQTVSIVCDGRDPDVIDLVSQDFETLLGRPGQRKVGSKKGGVEIRKTSRDYLRLFDSLGLVKGSGEQQQALRKVCVPPAILRSPRNVIREFLRGVWEADGFVQNGKPRMVLYSKSEDFLREIQFLMMGFGVTSKIFVADKVATVDGKTHRYTGRELRLRKPEVLVFKREIGFVSKRKQAKFATHPNRTKGNGWSAPIRWQDTIASIEPSRQSVVWDATIRPDHCFSAAGIWVHNSEEEALAPSRVLSAFDPDVLAEMKEDTRRPIEKIGKINIYQKHMVGKRYCAGSDTSHGTGNDANVTVVLDVQTGSIVADINDAYIQPEELASLSVKMLALYENPIWAIEDNDWGILTIRKAQELGYRKLFEQRDRIGRPNGKIGWHTGESTRTLLYGELIEAVSERAFMTPSEHGLAQFGSVIRNPDKNGRIEAMTGAHDDYPLACGIAWQMRKYAFSAGKRVIKAKKFNKKKMAFA